MFNLNIVSGYSLIWVVTYCKYFLLEGRSKVNVLLTTGNKVDVIKKGKTYIYAL